MHAFIEELTPYHIKQIEPPKLDKPIPKWMQLKYIVPQSKIFIVETSMEGTWYTCTLVYDAWTKESDAITIEHDLAKCINESITSGLFLTRVQEQAPEIMAVTIARWASINPLDDPMRAVQRDWELQQWIGLGMMSVTFMFVTMLSWTAVYRRKRQEEEEHWGVRLGTDRGVEEMLKIGWDGQKAYQKEMMGYRDNDSVFIGGFEQTHRALMTSSTTMSSKELTTSSSKESKQSILNAQVLSRL
jgi:hypothetical protein